MKLEVSSFDDHNQPIVLVFPDATATVADGSLIIVAPDGGQLIAGFAPDMWSTFQIVHEE